MIFYYYNVKVNVKTHNIIAKKQCTGKIFIFNYLCKCKKSTKEQNFFATYFNVKV